MNIRHPNKLRVPLSQIPMSLKRFSQIFYFILIFGCSKEIKETENKIELSSIKDIASSNIKIEGMIPLETNSSNLMGLDLRVILSDTLIYIMDESTKDGIHIFDEKGNYFKTIANVGEGPNYIPAMVDFLVTGTGFIEVLSTRGSLAENYRFDQEGNFHKIFSLEYVATSFARLPDNTYLFYGGYNLPIIEYRVLKTDSLGNKIQYFLPNTYKNNMLPMTEKNFFKTGNDLFIIESFQNVFYRYENDSVKVVLNADYGNYNLPANFWEMDIMDGFQVINKNGFANIRTIHKGLDKIMVDVMYQKEAEVTKDIVFFTQEFQPIFKIKADRNEKFIFYYPIGINNNDQILFLTYKSILDKYLENNKISTGVWELPKSEFDYPVILKTVISP